MGGLPTRTQTSRRCATGGPLTCWVAAVVALGMIVAVGSALGRGSDVRPNKDGSICAKKADSCTDEKGSFALEFQLNGDSDCVWRIDIDYGDGATETGQYADTDTPYRLRHSYSSRKSYAVEIQLSSGQSPSGVVQCGDYAESYRVQYPTKPKKNDVHRFQGYVELPPSGKGRLVMSHPGPGYVELAVTKGTDWRNGLTEFDDLRHGFGVVARARFDGRNWRADWVERWNRQEGGDAHPRAERPSP